MDTMFWVWIGVFVITFFVEIMTMDLVAIWCTFASVIPLILAAANLVGWEVQVVIFIVLSVVMVFALRKIAKKWLYKYSSKEDFNLNQGKVVKLLENTEEGIGQVKINDVVWTAKIEDGEDYSKGTKVEIIKMSGNKVIVKKVEIKESKEKK